jgi:hypothetical protein
MARWRTRAWVTAVAIASLSLVGGGNHAAAQAPRSTHAKPLAQSLSADAKRDYDAGKMLFDDGDYATALLKYQAAYDATHDARLLWDVAVCEKSLRHYATTLATLARYQAEGGDLLSAGDRRDAQELSRAIAPFTSAQTVNVSEEGAEVWIDGQLVGRSPLLAPVVLDLGTHHVRIVKDGFRPWSRDMPVGGSAPTAVAALLERQAGHLDLTLPAEATVAIDGHDAGRGPTLSVDLPAGPHALRVSAPNLRPIVTDVIVEDGKSRALDLKLEPEAAPSSEVHVTVGCGRPEPLPQDDLSVFFDDATVSALPLGVRMRREPGREVIAYIAYRVAPGRHTVHVAALGCNARDAVVDAPEGGVANVTGALPPSDDWYEGSPAGSHDGWRLSGGIIETSVGFGNYGDFFLQQSPKPPNIVGLTLVGASIATGYEGRWTTGLVEARFEGGRATGLDNNPVFNATLSQWLIGVRPGLRLPLYIAALSGGLGLDIGQYFFSPDSGSSVSGVLVSGSAWAAVDVQPFCEWGFQVGAESSVYDYTANKVSQNDFITSFWGHVTFTPNSACTHKQGGLLRIEGNVK